MTPVERAAHLEADDSLEHAHAGAASSATSSTAVPEADEEVDLHFVALVHVDGGLYELDGRKDAPVRHGDTSAESFLLDAGAVVKKFVQMGGDSLSFNAIAMGPSAGGRDVLDGAGVGGSKETAATGGGIDRSSGAARVDSVANTLKAAQVAAQLILTGTPARSPGVAGASWSSDAASACRAR